VSSSSEGEGRGKIGGRMGRGREEEELGKGLLFVGAGVERE